ncbi:MAG: hypothetical protein H3C28_01340 [Sphingomonadales bacterium]|nr:hypothetical protein [Sphingomonadales bacterium]
MIDRKSAFAANMHATVPALMVLCVFLGAQRFVLSNIYAYVALLPFTFAVYFHDYNKKLSNTLIIIALFLCVDNGGKIYTETNNIVRFVIYVTAILSMLEGARFDIRRVFIFSLFFLVLIAITLLNDNPIDYKTAFRDFLLTILAFLVLCRSSTSFTYAIDTGFIAQLLTIYIAAELVNIMFFYSLDRDGYLSYNSLKSLIVLPTFYYMFSGRIRLAVAIGLMTAVVLLAYGTRMIFLAYIFACVIALLRGRIIKGYNIISILFLVFIATISLSYSSLELESYKVAGIFYQLFETNSVMDYLYLIDPVRYTEHQLFFDRNFLSILIGDGFGSGLIDRNNDFSFVSPYSTAFSDEELNEGIFYNLHDFWIDIGLRFGFLSIVLTYFFVINRMFSKKESIAILSMTEFVLLTCASFSTLGLIAIALIALAVLSTQDPFKSALSLPSGHVRQAI